MRLLLAVGQYSDSLLWLCEENDWTVDSAEDGASALAKLCGGQYDLLAVSACLAGLDGLALGDAYAASAPCCPARILLIQPDEWPRPAWADCTAPIGASPDKLHKLLLILSKKPLPKLAAAYGAQALDLSRRFLMEIGMDRRYKGFEYAVWLLSRLCQCSTAEQLAMETLYQACGQTFRVQPASVERCLRVAIESVFTHGSLKGIDRYFGVTVDPERGKPTNRAFLLQGMLQLRYSFTAALSPNNSDTHHNPAAPTMV